MMANEPVTPIQSALDRLAAREPGARADLLFACRARVELIARRMLRDFQRVRRWVETDDVVQDCLLKLDQALADLSFDNTGQFLRLAAQRVRWSLIDLARSLFGPQGLAAHHQTPDTASGPGAVDRAAAPDDDSGAFTRWDEFHEQVDALPEEPREVFELRWYHGLTQGEIASRLGVDVRTVKRRWREARALLAEALGMSPPT